MPRFKDLGFASEMILTVLVFLVSWTSNPSEQGLSLQQKLLSNIQSSKLVTDLIREEGYLFPIGKRVNVAFASVQGAWWWYCWCSSHSPSMSALHAIPILLCQRGDGPSHLLAGGDAQRLLYLSPSRKTVMKTAQVLEQRCHENVI